jgi:hypothetical protein
MPADLATFETGLQAALTTKLTTIFEDIPAGGSPGKTAAVKAEEIATAIAQETRNALQILIPTFTVNTSVSTVVTNPPVGVPPADAYPVGSGSGSGVGTIS